MLKIQPNYRTFRGGKILSKRRNKDNWDVYLSGGEIAMDVDVDGRKVQIGDWLVFEENEKSQYGKKAEWVIMEKEFFSEWLKVIGG